MFSTISMFLVFTQFFDCFYSIHDRFLDICGQFSIQLTVSSYLFTIPSSFRASELTSSICVIVIVKYCTVFLCISMTNSTSDYNRYCYTDIESFY